MKLDELLNEHAPQALTFAVKNTIRKLQIEKSEAETPHVKLMIQVEQDLFKKLDTVLDDRIEAREVWNSMSKQAKARLPQTAHIKDYLS